MQFFMDRFNTLLSAAEEGSYSTSVAMLGYAAFAPVCKLVQPADLHVIFDEVFARCRHLFSRFVFLCVASVRTLAFIIPRRIHENAFDESTPNLARFLDALTAVVAMLPALHDAHRQAMAEAIAFIFSKYTSVPAVHRATLHGPASSLLAVILSREDCGPPLAARLSTL
jgi:hypothetical protein